MAMHIEIKFVCDGFDQAKEVVTAVQRLSTLPYRLEGFGSPLVKEIVPLADPHDTEDRNPNRNGIPPKVQFPDIKVDPVRANINPGEPLITKLSEATKTVVLNGLPWGMGTKYEQHLRLLWKRGLVKFDGNKYYL